jgi:hypothetical protein
VYLLNGFNGSNIEWEARDMDAVLDKLTGDADLEESVVVFPDGDSGWYVDTSAGHFRSMIVQEIVPLVDRAYVLVSDEGLGRTARAALREHVGELRLAAPA